jgi:peptide deformylase
MILPLVEQTHPILFKELDTFDFNNPPIDPVELGNNLIETMSAKNGLGLSANQCGLPYRCFVLRSQDPFIVFNPRLVDETSELVDMEEGCLSTPFLFVRVKRPKSIKVRYQDHTGETHTRKLTGMTARAFLHEMDHLNGVMFTARANRVHLERARKNQKLYMRKIKKKQGL